MMKIYIFCKGNVLFVSVVSRSLLGHHIDVSVFKLDDGSFSDGLSLQKPLVMNGRAEAVAQPQGDHFFPLLVSVEHDSALLVVVVIVSLCYEPTSLSASFRNIPRPLRAKLRMGTSLQGMILPLPCSR